MLPSAEPLMKQPSVSSTASALTAESWAWKLWRWSLSVRSSTLIQPFLPPLSNRCCFGARASTVAPDSWQIKPAIRPTQLVRFQSPSYTGLGSGDGLCYDSMHYMVKFVDHLKNIQDNCAFPTFGHQFGEDPSICV